MKKMYLLILPVILHGLTVAEVDIKKISPEKKYEISDVQGIRIHNAQEGLLVMRILKTIDDPNMMSQKADILVNLYQIQNTQDVDNLPDLGAHPVPERQLQIEAIQEMRKLNFKTCKEKIYPILNDYLVFMESNGKSHSRGMLQLNIAHLIMDNIHDKDVRDLGKKYLESAAMQEWTKGRIATSILDYDVSKITDADDPDLSVRTNMLLKTACLPSLEQQLRAPKRIGKSQEILNKLYEGRYEKLLEYISANRSLLGETQKYFLSYASVMHALKKKNNQQNLTDSELKLVELAKECRENLLEKTSVIEAGDQLLDRALQNYSQK